MYINDSHFKRQQRKMKTKLKKKKKQNIKIKTNLKRMNAKNKFI